ncbi:MAG TPA: phosphatase PAP2 family protein, partial [Blastococcus sp.]|nr:phosphatase PAP2 family protein [Blastococcus sp.]
MTAGEETTDRPVPDLAGSRPGQRSLWHPLVVLPELAWMLALIFGYSLARLIVVDPGGAVHNARLLWMAERDLHLPSETTFQQLVVHWPAVLRLANEYYASAHFPVTAVFLFWIYVWRHDAWRWVRNAMTAFTGAALLIEA